MPASYDYAPRSFRLNSSLAVRRGRAERHNPTSIATIEFNYNQIQWETGDASGGSNGLGGTSATAGYSNGLSGSDNVHYQLPGSLVNGALLDGGPDSLTGHSLDSNVLGRYDFSVRNGAVVVPTTTPEPMSMGLLGLGLMGRWAARKRLTRP